MRGGAPDTPKRLALLLPDMRGGGAERVALRLAQDFLAAGHEVDLVLLEATGDLMPLVPKAVRIVDLKAPRIRSAVLPLRRYLRERQPDAVQISMWPLTVAGIMAHRLARSRARLVLSDHIVLTQQYGADKKVFAYLRKTIRFFYPLADARIQVSNEAADDLARIAGLPRASIDVIYNPVAKPPASARPSAEIEALWGRADGRIITVGSFKEQKNHKLLIRAFARLRRQRAARLMILGEGPLRPELEALARQEGVASDVLMPGFAADPWPYYHSADLFALSSDYEGYPLVLIEALRAGLPVVSTDCPAGPREILGDNRYGLLVPTRDVDALANAMMKALQARSDPDRLKQRAEQLSGDNASKRYLSLMLGEDAE